MVTSDVVAVAAFGVREHALTRQRRNVRGSEEMDLELRWNFRPCQYPSEQVGEQRWKGP
jgi:hypothetical protein